MIREVDDGEDDGEDDVSDTVRLMYGEAMRAIHMRQCRLDGLLGTVVA